MPKTYRSLTPLPTTKYQYDVLHPGREMVDATTGMLLTETYYSDEKWGCSLLQEHVLGTFQELPNAYFKHLKWGRCKCYCNEDFVALYRNAPDQYKINWHLHPLKYPNGNIRGPVVRERVWKK